jgi:hypothetical protein
MLAMNNFDPAVRNLKWLARITGSLSRVIVIKRGAGDSGVVRRLGTFCGAMPTKVPRAVMKDMFTCWQCICASHRLGFQVQCSGPSTFPRERYREWVLAAQSASLCMTSF